MKVWSHSASEMPPSEDMSVGDVGRTSVGRGQALGVLTRSERTSLMQRAWMYGGWPGQQLSQFGRNLKREIILFANRHNFGGIFENPSALKTQSSIIQRLQHAGWNDCFGEVAETIPHSDSPLKTIFFLLNEPHAHRQHDWIWAA